MELGDLVVVWHLETTGLSVYHQEPMEIGYAILRVTSNDKKSLKFQRIGSTVSQLTLADVEPSPEATGKHHITSECCENIILTHPAWCPLKPLARYSVG